MRVSMGENAGDPEAESFSKNMRKIWITLMKNFKNLAICSLQPTWRRFHPKADSIAQHIARDSILENNSSNF